LLHMTSSSQTRSATDSTAKVDVGAEHSHQSPATVHALHA
jgi:hypothetical protein